MHSNFNHKDGQSLAADDQARSFLLQESRERVTSLIPQLYQRLNAVCGFEDGDRALLEELQGQKWIYVGDCFVAADRVAFTSAGTVRLI
jgi:hypothetical protein